MLLRTMREKPSARGEARRVHRIAGAGNGARTERQRVGFVGGRREPRVIAAKRGGMRQKVVRDQHRLGAAQVRVGRHQRRPGTFGLIGAGADQRRDARLQRRDAAAQIQPQIERHLLVARAAGMQTPAGVANPLDQLALDEAVNVFVRA